MLLRDSTGESAMDRAGDSSMNSQAPGLPDHQKNKIITSNLHYYREMVKPRYILHTRFNPTENNIDQLLISFREYAVGKYFPYDISDYYQRLQY